MGSRKKKHDVGCPVFQVQATLGLRTQRRTEGTAWSGRVNIGSIVRPREKVSDPVSVCSEDSLGCPLYQSEWVDYDDVTNSPQP